MRVHELRLRKLKARQVVFVLRYGAAESQKLQMSRLTVTADLSSKRLSPKQSQVQVVALSNDGIATVLAAEELGRGIADLDDVVARSH